MPKSVSVLIRAYNEEEHIGRLLTGIGRQSIREVQVVLMDSGSTDATLSIASRFGVEVLHIAPEEFSFGRALNRGFEHCRGDVVVLASAHVYPVYEDWLELLTGPFKDDRVALAFGRQQGDGRTKFSEHQVFGAWFPPESSSSQSSPFCNNANAAVRHSVWQEFRYDERLTGLEDLDWAKRVQGAGMKISYVAEARVVHVHDEEWLQVLNRYRREAMALKTIFPEERFGFHDFLRLFMSNTLSDLRHAFRQRRLVGEASSILAFRLMQFWGTYRGFRQRGPVSSGLRNRFYYPDRNDETHPPLERGRSAIDYHRESLSDKT
jgi:glycosyltransferase involved in cell wall biosynthesis